MKKRKAPILLSFFALTNGKDIHVRGQLSYMIVKDLSFQELSLWKMFKSMINLYRTKALKEQRLEIHFDTCSTETLTDEYGAFCLNMHSENNPQKLSKIVLENELEILPESALYSSGIQYIKSDRIVVSDIDDTILESFIKSKWKKIKAMLFTQVENRKPVENIRNLLLEAERKQSAVCYLSNSEHNLFPILNSFLNHNKFPAGPILLKHLRSTMDLILGRKNPDGDTHKKETLEMLLEMFTNKKFTLIGDNTQNDLIIYLEMAKKYPQLIEQIIIREVEPQKKDQELLIKAHDTLVPKNITFNFAPTFKQAIIK